MWWVVLSVNVTLGDSDKSALTLDLLPDSLGWWIVASALGSIGDLSPTVTSMRRLAWGLVVINLLAIVNFQHPPPPDSYYAFYEPPQLPNETLEFLYSIRNTLGWAMSLIFVWKGLQLTQQIAVRSGADELAQQAQFRRRFYCGGNLIFLPLFWLGSLLLSPAMTIAVAVVAFPLYLAAWVLVWLYLRKFSAWADENAKANATWFELWDGEEIEIVEQSQTGRWNFRISTLLLASALLAAIVSHWTLAKTLTKMRQEELHSQALIETYRRELTKVHVRDRARIYVKHVPTLDDETWEWSVYVPNDIDVVWRVKLNDVVRHEIPQKFDGELTVPSGYSILTAKVDAESGRLTIAVRWKMKIREFGEGTFTHVPMDEVATRTIDFDASDWEGSSGGWGGDAEAGVNPDTQMPMQLLERIFHGSSTGQAAPTSAAGLQFWFEVDQPRVREVDIEPEP